MLSGFAIGEPRTAGPPFPASRIVENRFRLDVWQLALTPESKTEIRLEGTPVGNLRPLPGPRILVELGDATTEIALVSDEPMAGVPRWWFQCPACDKRCRHIYWPEWQCRQCLRLEHRCRHSGRWGNAARLNWLRRRLGTPQRRRARHRLLAQQIAEEEERFLAGMRRFAAAIEKQTQPPD